jgi:hypothetical protein
VPDRHPDTDLLCELEPVAERLLNRHLSMAKEWLPHEYVPWSLGRDFDVEPWTPDQPRLTGVAQAVGRPASGLISSARQRPRHLPRLSPQCANDATPCTAPRLATRPERWPHSRLGSPARMSTAASLLPRPSWPTA